MPPVKRHGGAKPKHTAQTVKKLFGYMGRFGLLWPFVLVCVLVSSGAGVAGTYFLKPAINQYILPFIGRQHPDMTAFALLLVKMAVIFAAGACATWINQRIMLYISTRTLYSIRTDLFRRLETLPIQYYDAHPHGELMSLFTNDTDTLRDMLSQTVPQLMSSTVTVTGVSVMMFVLNPLLAGILALTVVLVMGVAGRIGKRSASAFRDQQKNIGIVNGYIEEMIEGQKVVKVFNREAETERRFAVLNDELCRSGTEANTFANILGPMMNNFSHIQYAAIAMCGAFLVIAGYMDIGTIASFLQYTRSFSQPVSMISQQFTLF